MSTQTDNAQSGTQPSKSSRRWRWLAGIAGGFLAVALVYTAYWAQVLRYHQTTDDAYVGGNVVQITPQIPGTVVGIGADDTQFVKTGQALVRLDQADAKVALDQAEAQLARTVRDVRNLFATSAQLEAAVQQRQTDLAAAQSDLARRQRLGTSGAVSGEELQHAIDAVKASQAALLARMRVGQPVALTADLYGASTVFHGKVAGFGAGTGSAFALLPAQNATGNWIKIMQRVPVRIALDPREVAAHPLQIGLSMKADVDVRGGEGARLPQLAGASAAWSTDVFDSSDALADARVAAIIAANQSASARAAAERSTPDRKLLANSPSAGVPLRLHAGAAQQPSVD